MAKSQLLFSMVDILRNRPGITIPELATHFGRSERSIYRWLKEMSEDLRMPLQSRNGGYYLPPDAESRAVALTPQELLVLRLSLNSRLFESGSPLKRHAESAWKKIRDAAPGAILESASDLDAAHSVAVKAPPFDADPDIARAIEDAVAGHRTLRAVYRSQKSDEVKNYTIDPYALVFRRHSWYVLAYCHSHRKIIQMRLGRFQSAEPTEGTFVPPSDFSADDYFRWSWEAWGGGEPTRVLVRFEPRVARMIAESERHPTQIVRMEPDGSALFEATVSSLEEFGVWVLGYGENATVLEPESLRDFVIANAEGLLSNYEPSVSPAPILS